MNVKFTSVKENFEVLDNTDRYTGIVHPDGSGGAIFQSLQWSKKSNGEWEVKSDCFMNINIFISDKGVASFLPKMGSYISIEQFKDEVDSFVKVCEVVKKKLELERKQ